jgi:tetratricopeptide (TPR) repeat protein
MNLKYAMPRQAIETTRNVNERAQTACAHAKDLEELGEFEAAREALSEFWQRIGERPKVAGLNVIGQAEVFLRAGALSGWIGSARQVPGAQEIAKDLISEAARLFDDCGLQERVAEARVDLAICYWREGAFDEARVSLDDALQHLGDLESEQRLRALLTRAIVEKLSLRPEDALKTHRQAAPLFHGSSNVALKGKFHNEYATVLKNLGLARNSADLIDQALVEYSAATVYAEEAGNKRFLASVENNVGNLFVRLGRFEEAHKHLDRARSLFTSLKDKGLVAQVDDSRARALISQGLLAKAEALSRGAVKVLVEGDELSLLAEALTTHGIALARLANYAKARPTLEKAIRTAQSAGDLESSGVASLSMVEELKDYLPFGELLAYYRMAETELARSQHPEILNRLGKCARRLLARGSFMPADHVGQTTVQNEDRQNIPLRAAQPPAVPPLLTGGSLDDQVLAYESGLIKQALETSDGSVTRAARMLGISHQGLAFILNGRHKDLLAARKPVKRRRRSIIRFH